MMDIGLLSMEFSYVICTVLFGTVVSCKLENIALGKKAYQSSDFADHLGVNLADKAVDGGLSQNYQDGSCSITQSEENAFWEVDLGKRFFIDHVTMYKRLYLPDWAATRLRDVELYLGNGTHNYSRFGYHEGNIESSVYTFELAKPVFGQWLRITRIASVVDFLELCEVEVYGYAQSYFRINHDRAGMDASYLTSMNLPSVTHCVYMCYKTSSCEAANYDEDMKMCDLFTSSSNEEAAGRLMLIPYE